MRSLRLMMIAAGLVGFVPALANAQNDPSPKNLLRLFVPNLKGVDYEVPTNPAVIAACKVDTVYNANKKAIGYTLRDGQGKLLRKFLDTNANGSLDQWSYYQDGFEVYRESDLDNDKSLDECRWLNAGGTRIATVKSEKVAANKWTLKIVGWKRISAEEASKVLVQALVDGDQSLLDTVLATPDELKELGLPQTVVAKATADVEARVQQVKAVQQGLKGWNRQTVWSRLDGMMPHLIPADADTRLEHDIVLYENAVIFGGAPNGQSNPAEMAFLQAPEIVKIGEAWKFVDLPRAVDPQKPLVASEGGIRGAIFGRGDAQNGGNEDPELAAALKALAKYDEANARAASKEELAKFHVGRIPLLNAVVKGAKSGDDKLLYNKQIVDSLAAAYQTGLYAAGMPLIDQFIERGDKLGSYAAFRKVSSEFALRNEQGGDLMVNQKKWMADLKKFIDAYPKTDETPEALLQLASVNEFNAEEEEARKYYDQLASNFSETDPGKKAAGALNRLGSVGKPFALKGPGLKNEVIDTAQHRGKPLLVAFWATWADPVKRDLPELIKVYQKRHAQGFEIVGVCLDEKAKDLEQFLQETPLPWAQVYEPGGLEKNPYATQYGIIALPTMFLIDGQGKVVSRTIRTAAELEKQLELLLANKDGVALGAAK